MFNFLLFIYVCVCNFDDKGFNLTQIVATDFRAVFKGGGGVI